MTLSGGTVTEHPGCLLLINFNKILIVSNSPTFLERNERLLTGAGVRILVAASAKEALKIHYRERVDLIIALLGRVGLRYRALGVSMPDGIVWFWIGTYTEYDRLIS